MATTIERMTNGAIKIVFDGEPFFLCNLTNVSVKRSKHNVTVSPPVREDEIVIEYNNLNILHIIYSDITTINGVAKPSDVLDGAALIANEVINGPVA